MIDINTIFKQAIKEDCPQTDVTTSLFIDKSQMGSAKIIAKETAIFCGEDVFKYVNDTAEFDLKVISYVRDGQEIKTKQVIAQLTGSTAHLLLVERVMLNLIQRLSGISTVTNRFVKALNNASIQVLDTRKTTPLLRDLERYAVVSGGGVNHRNTLSDMVLIKENHLRSINHSAEQLRDKISLLKSENPNMKVELEISQMEELETYDFTNIDIVMVDNFSIKQIHQASRYIRKHYPHLQIEYSGNVNLDNIQQYATCDIDRISIGALTHSVKSVDFSMLFETST